MMEEMLNDTLQMFNIEGLEFHRNYSIQVAAINTAGVGEYSTAIIGTTALPPSKAGLILD